MGFALWSAVAGIGMWTGVKEGLDRAKAYLGTSVVVVAILVASQIYGDPRQASWAIEQTLSAAMLFLPPLLYLMHSKRVANTFGTATTKLPSDDSDVRAATTFGTATTNGPSDDSDLRVLYSQMRAGHVFVLGLLDEERRLPREQLVLLFRRVYSGPGDYPLELVMEFLRGRGLIEETEGIDGVGLSARGRAFLAWCYETGRLRRVAGAGR